MNKSLLLGLVTGAALAWPTLSFAEGVAGSPHDFQKRSWNTSKSLCGVCHVMHGATDNSVPLWGHAATVAVFIPYSSPTLDATKASNLSGSSRACLSCHDGTVAVNNFGGMIQGGGNVEMVDPIFQLGTDLSNDHPIGIDYNSTLAQADGGLHDPELTLVTGPDFTGAQTISKELLRNGKIECVTCHDIHKKRGASKNSDRMLIMDGPSYAGSKLCLTCHQK